MQLPCEQLTSDRGGSPLQQALGAGKSIIRGLQSVITVADNPTDPEDEYTQSYNLTCDIPDSKNKANCGWRVGAARIVRAALVVRFNLFP